MTHWSSSENTIVYFRDQSDTSKHEDIFANSINDDWEYALQRERDFIYKEVEKTRATEVNRAAIIFFIIFPLFNIKLIYIKWFISIITNN